MHHCPECGSGDYKVISADYYHCGNCSYEGPRKISDYLDGLSLALEDGRLSSSGRVDYFEGMYDAGRS